jgi:outer membrane protein OmpA-like peptidoglycan-associated protein/ABC-type taurine transport system substrate-binding protein
MNRKIVGVIAIIVLGIIVVLMIKFLAPVISKWKQKNSSDAKDTKGTVRVLKDNFVGYNILCSGEMKRRLRSEGYVLTCVDDNANYEQRMKQLTANEAEFAVATVDSYILNSVSEQFSGVIVAGIDQSKGVDALVGKGITSLEDLKARRGNYKIAFTSKSPSEHFLKAIGSHFDIPELRMRKANWRIETDGSTEALKKLLAGKADLAMLWEPDVSKALAEKGITRIMGTEDTRDLVVDILLTNRDFAKNHPEIVNMVLSNYFETLKYYRENTQVLKTEIAAYAKLPEEQVEKMLKGIEWMTLEDNAKNWFGISSLGKNAKNGMADTIESTVAILIDSGDFKKSPLPDGDPYRLINSSFIEALYRQNYAEQNAPVAGVLPKPEANSQEKQFAPLNESAWAGLKEVGTLKVLPITFQSGTSNLSLEGKEELDKAAKNLAHYPNYRVVIEGHTPFKGDPEMNKNLSQERADAVKRYFMVTHGTDERRIKTIGKGGDSPLPRFEGESDRAYNYRLPRVELHLMSEVL